MKLSAMLSVEAVKLFRFTCDPPMKAMPLLLTRITLAFCPAACEMLPAITLGLISWMRLSEVKFAPCTRLLVARLSTWRNCTLCPALRLKLCQLRMDLLPT